MDLWEAGRPVVIREVRRARVYSLTPVRVVRDAGSWSALYLSPGSRCLWPQTAGGDSIRIPADEWILAEEDWPFGGVLFLVQPGSGFTVLACYNHEQGLDHWKINLEEPMRRTPLGFDYMDQILDVLLSPDRTDWHWKDENELREARARGLFTDDQVREIYLRGERAVRALQRRESPFDVDWEHWKPEPGWQAPLDPPPGWDRTSGMKQAP